MLFMLQPAARLGGRLRRGLAPWRRSALAAARSCRSRARAASGASAGDAPDERLRGVESAIRRHNGVVICGGDFERWDLQVRGGLLGLDAHAHGGRGARRRAPADAVPRTGRASRGWGSRLRRLRRCSRPGPRSSSAGSSRRSWRPARCCWRLDAARLRGGRRHRAARARRPGRATRRRRRRPPEALEPVRSPNGQAPADIAGRAPRRSRACRANGARRRSKRRRRSRARRDEHVSTRPAEEDARRARAASAPGASGASTRKRAGPAPGSSGRPGRGSSRTCGRTGSWSVVSFVLTVLGGGRRPRRAVAAGDRDRQRDRRQRAARHRSQDLFGANPDQYRLLVFIVGARVPDRDRQPRRARAQRLRQRQDRAEHGAGPAQRPVRALPSGSRSPSTTSATPAQLMSQINFQAVVGRQRS